VKSQTHLLEIVRALDSASCLASRLNRWQQKTNQHTDDDDYHQEFHECKTPGKTVKA
jgi:hypothetical protein